MALQHNKLRMSFGIPLIIIMSIYVIGFFSPQAYSKPSEKKMHVVIVSITDFDDNGWGNPTLTDNIKKASFELESFFRKNFSNTQFHILRSKKETTKNSIDSLVNEMRTFAKGTLTLVFILSHGEIYKGKSIGGNYLNQDVKVITSDTYKKIFQTKVLESIMITWID